MSLTAAERAVVETIAARRAELVDLAGALIACDTAVGPDGRGDEARLQGALAERLAAAGAEVDLWVPDDGVVAGSRQVPPGFSFAGRPQLAGRFAGARGGRSLLCNGHVDVVPAGDRAAWSAEPFAPVVRDGRLFGRGACDMKGGVAAMVFAAEALRAAGVRLAGDLVVCTVTDEEETGAGAIAAVARGVRADAGLVAEPTGFDAWVACRGDVVGTLTVPGRLGHAGLEHDPAAGGAVNAIDKARVLLNALARRHDEWQRRPDHQHALLSPGHLMATRIAGGDWPVNVPATCAITLHVAYLPAHADAGGWGSRVEAEVRECVAAAAAADPWLAQHPPALEWTLDIPAVEVDADEPVIAVALEAGTDLGRPGRRAGLDSWHDGATFTRFGATPTIAYGPGSVALAHTVDESVPVADLVACAQAYAVAAMRWCGVA